MADGCLTSHMDASGVEAAIAIVECMAVVLTAHAILAGRADGQHPDLHAGREHPALRPGRHDHLPGQGLPPDAGGRPRQCDGCERNRALQREVLGTPGKPLCHLPGRHGAICLSCIFGVSPASRVTPGLGVLLTTRALSHDASFPGAEAAWSLDAGVMGAHLGNGLLVP